MEASMKRAEKLVHATNSALAQMKFSLMFEDGLGGGEKPFRRAEALQPLFCSDGEDLQQCQDQFAVEANEMLSKMDKMFGSANVTRKNWKALDRIKEINRKMNALRQDHPKLRGTEHSSEKLVSLLAEEKLSPQKSSGKSSLRTKPPSPCKRETEPPEKRHRTPKKPHPPSSTQSPVKSKEELKSNILETREIVDRGVHTARHLAQKVDNMSRNERKEKATSETNLRSLDGKSESNETTRSGGHARRSGRGEKGGDSVGGGQPRNARVVDVKRRDSQRGRRWNLGVQRLPSVDIRGGLQLQKVHSLEIPGWGDAGAEKANTGIHIVSHERIERAKMDEVLSEVRGEGRCCSGVRGNAPGNCVECTNCGKVMRVQGTRVDPRRVDEILRKCRFNVFDPRIDEFVEKCAAADAWKACGKGSAGTGEEVGSEAEEKAEGKRSEVGPKAVRGCSLEDLSKQLSTKYRQEAEELEGHHLRLNGLLKSLFRKIDESREVFEGCHLLRNGKVECSRVLTATEPVVVSLMGSPVANRRKQKLDKRDVRNRNKSRTKESRPSEGTEGARMTVVARGARGKRNLERKSWKENEEGEMPVWPGGGGAVPGTEGTRSCREAATPASTLLERSWGFNQPEAAFGKGSTEEASLSSVQVGVTGLRMAKGGKGVKRPDLKEEGKAARATPTQSSGSSSPQKQGIGPHLTEGDLSPETSLKGGETENAQVAVSVRNEGKASSEASTERSESNYESDFESETNEAEEGGGEYEDVEPEVVPDDKKLSTISEVDSELEKKLSEEQKTQRDSLDSSGLLDEPKPSDEGLGWNYPPNALHVKERNTPSLTPEASHTSKTEDIPSLKSTPTELVTSLKEILSALKDQFARTETLAEKLTESVRQDKGERTPSEDDVPSPWKLPLETLVENLRSARKESPAAPKPPSAQTQYGGVSADSLSDEGGSSLGEVVEGAQRKCDASFLRLDDRRKASWLSSGQKEATKIVSGSKLNVNSDEVSYSEGEIPSNLMVDSEGWSSRSVGEFRQ